MGVSNRLEKLYMTPVLIMVINHEDHNLDDKFGLFIHLTKTIGAPVYSYKRNRCNLKFYII
jgi:hypothetical protein